MTVLSHRYAPRGGCLELGMPTKAGAAYLAVLDGLTGPRRLRLRDGLWVAAEGLVYAEYDPAVHLLTWFPVPEEWPRFWAVDFGFRHPFVCSMWAADPDGRLYRYREHYGTGRTVDDWATTILDSVRQPVVDDPVRERPEHWRWTEPKPEAIICDHDAEGREAWLFPDVLHDAGMTWEDALSAVGGRVDKARLWEALAPSMGYMSLLRNLRNFDEAGLSDEAAEQVCRRLADPEQVAKSRQFPYRFLSAHLNAPSQRWGHALDKALTASTANIPAFGGRTLVLVDTSASMTQVSFSARSQVTPAWTAALFGVALANRNPGGVDLYGFADGQFPHPVQRGGSVLRECERFIGRTGEVGHGTQIAEAVRRTYRSHDRVIILSDMQTMSDRGWAGGVTDAAPQHVPMYGFNLLGYAHGAMSSGLGTRHELGSLTDATFRMLPLLEAGRNADWPWVTAAE